MGLCRMAVAIESPSVDFDGINPLSFQLIFDVGQVMTKDLEML